MSRACSSQPNTQEETTPSNPTAASAAKTSSKSTSPRPISACWWIYPEAERLGYDVLLSAAAEGRSEDKAVEALPGHRCEALILLGTRTEPARLDALGRRAATVSVGRRVPRAHVDFVQSAEGKGVRQAMDHLVELGHRRIVHIDGGRGPGSAERRCSYRAAMRRHGLESEIRVIPGEHTEQSGV